MTKYAFISDIHANYDALELVFKDIEKRNVDKIICLGDLVNKYFYPEKVVDHIKKECDIVIKGNHEEAVTTNENFKWIRPKLGLERLEYLENLPLIERLKIDRFFLNLFHATPFNITQMFNPLIDNKNYLGGELTNYKDMFIDNEKQISITGHTHMSYIGKENNNALELIDNNFEQLDDSRYIINVGSVGDPNILVNNNITIDSYISYGILEDNKFYIIKIPYKETLKKIYLDRLDMEQNNKAPYSPKDDSVIFNSLLDMGYTKKCLKKY